MLNLARIDSARDADVEDDGQGPVPQVFVRVFSTPPGAPWEQARAAGLEARHGAPLPMAELVMRLRRLGAWSPGNPGRYAAYYVRAAEFTRPFETTVEVDGQPMRVAFGSSTDRLKNVRIAGLAAVAVFAAVVVGGIGMTMALGARTEASERLDRLEEALASRQRAALAARTMATQATALKDALGQARPVGDVLADLSWASAVKAPEARIDAVHWEHGLLAFETRGDLRPISGDLPLERSEQQIRPGVWLWGLRVSGAGR